MKTLHSWMQSETNPELKADRAGAEFNIAPQFEANCGSV
jgi:hypothetical protein